MKLKRQQTARHQLKLAQHNITAVLQSNSAGGLVQLMGGGVQHTDEAVRGRQLLLLQSRQSVINMVMVTWSSVRTMHTNTSTRSLVSSHTWVQLKQSFNAKYKVVRDLVRIECPLSGREPCQVRAYLCH